MDSSPVSAPSNDFKARRKDDGLPGRLSPIFWRLSLILLSKPEDTLRRSSLVDKVGYGLPSCPELSFALANVVTQGDVSSGGVVQHPLQRAARHELLGDARKGCAQTVPLHCRRCL